MKSLKYTADREITLFNHTKIFLEENDVSKKLLLNCDIEVNEKKIDSSNFETYILNIGDKVEIFPNIHFTAAGIAIVTALSSTAFAATTAGVIIAKGIALALYVGASVFLNWAVNKLFPPDEPTSVTNENNTLPEIGAASNQQRIYQRLPLVVGFFRCTPDLAVAPRSAIIDNNQYIYHLFCVSAGNVEITDIKKKIHY